MHKQASDSSKTRRTAKEALQLQLLKWTIKEHQPQPLHSTIGYIPGELSFAANSRELERTRANSGELRANSPAVRRHLHYGELRRTFAGVRRTFAGIRRSSLGFARVRANSAANWRTVRRKIRSRDEIPTTSNKRSPRPRFAANVVRRERRSPRTKFTHGELQFTEKRTLNGVNDRSPRTDVR